MITNSLIKVPLIAGVPMMIILLYVIMI